MEVNGQLNSRTALPLAVVHPISVEGQVGATAVLDSSEKSKYLVLDRNRTMVPRSFGSRSRHHTDDVSLASHLLTLYRLLTLNTSGSLNEREVMLIA